MKKEGIRPNINPKFVDHFFSEDEKIIIKKLSREWYITNGGTVQLGVSSKYKYILMKPTPPFQELFNIEREVIVIFSDYNNFEPRTLDAFDETAKRLQHLRIEKVCSILISKDDNIENKIRSLLKSDAEYQVIVPFTYSELLAYYDSYFLRNRFKEHFYSRDLFAFQSPLKRDTYFFGRSDIIHEIVNRHKSNESSGLFGLRKTGKTSIIFGIQRSIKRDDGISVFIDCQNPGFHQKRWFKVLKYIIDEIKLQNNIAAIVKDDSFYTEESASVIFEKDLLKLSKKVNERNILIIFDEIEHISPTISISKHWNNGNDFIFFWQTLRSIFQKNNNLFSYLIFGTNPKCVETPLINGIDNPIFNQIPYQYIPQFTVQQTKEMVQKIGKTMGLNFDEVIFSKLNDDFGGHPFLMRNVCSVINTLVSFERPARVDKDLYEKGKKIFVQKYDSYFEMILSVLKEYYIDEYEMLKHLAIGDIETFYLFANSSPEYTNHLLGYKILDRNKEGFFFNIESIKHHLISKNKYKKLKLTYHEKLKEISERRNEIEPKLRQIIRTTLISNFGENEAKRKVLDVFGEPRKSKYLSGSLKEIFNPNNSEIYFEDLKKIIEKYWSYFEFVFGKDKEAFSTYMKSINKFRADAHAKDISDEEMNFVRVCFTKVEAFIDKYL